MTKGELNGKQHVHFVDGDNYSGINKREYFAGLAMNGLSSDPEMDFSITNIKQLCEVSVKIADTLLEELSKEK